MTLLFTNYFKKQLKRLKKKYPRIKDDILPRLKGFDPSVEIALGEGVYKLRVASRDMKKGKSGGFRLYVFLLFQDGVLVPMAIHTKSDQEMLSDEALKYHFDQMSFELELRNGHLRETSGNDTV